MKVSERERESSASHPNTKKCDKQPLGRWKAKPDPDAANNLDETEKNRLMTCIRDTKVNSDDTEYNPDNGPEVHITARRTKFHNGEGGRGASNDLAQALREARLTGAFYSVRYYDFGISHNSTLPP